MFGLVLFLIVGTFFFSALLTPMVYSLADYLSLTFGYPFSRFFDRVAMVVLLIFVLIFHKYFHFSDFNGYVSSCNWKLKLKRLTFGAFFTTSVVLCAAYLAIYNGKMMWRMEFTDGRITYLYICFYIITNLLLGVIISLIEEGFFRVLFFNSLKKRYACFLAAAVSSLCYGFVHFIIPVKAFEYTKFSFFAGFEYIGIVLANILRPELLCSYLGMVLVGLILCYTMQKTRSFALCVGIHTGFVVGLKVTKLLSSIAPGIVVPEGASKRYFLVGRPEALIAFIVIFCVIFLCVKYLPSFTKDERV